MKLSRLIAAEASGIPVPAFLSKSAFGAHESPRDFCRSVLDRLGNDIILRSDREEEDREVALAGVFTSIPLPQATEESLHALLLDAGYFENPANFFLQRYVPPRLSGVCFSRSPGRPWKKARFIEWSRQAFSVTEGSGRSRHADLEDDPPRDIAPFRRALEKTMEWAEKHFQAPIDCEWVYDGRRLWIVQIRPVESEDIRAAFALDGRTFSRELAEERFPQPMTPLGWSLIENALPRNLERLDQLLGMKTEKGLRPSFFYKSFVYTDPGFFRYPRLKLRWSFFLNPFRKLFWRLLLSLLGAPLQWLKGKKAAPSILRSVLKENRDLVASSWADKKEGCLARLSELEKAIETSPHLSDLELFEEIQAISLDFFEDDLVVFVLKTAWALDVTASELETVRLDDKNPHWKMRKDLLELKKAVSADGALSSSAAELWRLCRERYGFLRSDWDIWRPTIGESPEAFLSLVSQMPEVPERTLSPRFSGTKIPPALEGLAELLQIDEEMNFHASYVLMVCKKLLLRVADRFAARGLIKQNQDIYFLTLPEVHGLLRGGPAVHPLVVQKRKRTFELASAAKPPPRLPPRPAASPAVIDPDHRARGLGASPGVARGPIHYLHDFHKLSDVPAHCILIAPHPHPHLIFVMDKIQGLITRHGGPLAHGFISAREQSLPAICQVALTLPEGTLAEINGSTGEIRW